MKAPAHTRRNGREWALQMITQADLNPFADADTILRFFWEQQWSFQQEETHQESSPLDEIAQQLPPEQRLATTGIRDFTENLVRGVLLNLPEIDARITPYCLNWSLDRVGVIERCVLRMAFYEMGFAKTPAPVVINEAVDLAKYFSNDEAGAFVNGILDRYARDLHRAAK